MRVCDQGLDSCKQEKLQKQEICRSRHANVQHLQERTLNAFAIITHVLRQGVLRVQLLFQQCLLQPLLMNINMSSYTWLDLCWSDNDWTPLPCGESANCSVGKWVWEEASSYFHKGFDILKKGLYLFCGPSPTRYSMTRSTAPLSLGRMGLANGGPGGCMPAKTVTHMEININTNTQKCTPLNHCLDSESIWCVFYRFRVLHFTSQTFAAFSYPGLCQTQYNVHTQMVPK